MVICICLGICDKKIRELLGEGAHDVRDLSRACGAGSDCGACLGKLERLVREAESAPHSAGGQDTRLKLLG